MPYRAPREGSISFAAGHTDPHSVLGVGALTGVLAAKAALEKHRLPGTIRFFGEPAEKVCGSKPVHAAKGYYDGADAFISYHPTPSTPTPVSGRPTAVRTGVCVFTFECAPPEAWGSKLISPRPREDSSANSHALARVPGAIDALCLMYTTTKYTKEAMFPHRHLDTERVHPSRRRRHLRQPAAPLQPDPVRLALPPGRGPGADLLGAGEQRQAGRRRHRHRYVQPG